VNGRKGHVSLAWLGAALIGTAGLLGADRVQDAQDAASPTAEAEAFAALDIAQAPGMGCSVVKELHFEMLPADAEPRVPPARHGRVCLAVYRSR